MLTATDTLPAPEANLKTDLPAAPAADLASPAPAARMANAVASSWNISQETLRANLSHNTPEAVDAFVWCFLWCIDAAHPMTVAEFAADINSDKTTVTRHMQGTYKHPETGRRLPISRAFLVNLQRFRRVQTDRALINDKGFVLSETAQRVITGCDLARESKTPVFIIGPSHIGKTVPLEWYAKNNNHGRTIYVRLNAASGLHGMVYAIAEKVGGIGLGGSTRQLIQGIKAGLSASMLLILDEVHELIHTYRKESFFACVEVIREIYDFCKCGLVLCATELLMKKIAQNRGELEQLLRRGVHKVILDDQPTINDVTAHIEAAGLKFPDYDLAVTVQIGSAEIVEQPYLILKQVGKEDGIKAICERLRYGRKYAAADKTGVTWGHFVFAHLTIKQNATKQVSQWK